MRRRESRSVWLFHVVDAHAVGSVVSGVGHLLRLSHHVHGRYLLLAGAALHHAYIRSVNHWCLHHGDARRMLLRRLWRVSGGIDVVVIVRRWPLRLLIVVVGIVRHLTVHAGLSDRGTCGIELIELALWHHLRVLTSIGWC